MKSQAVDFESARKKKRIYRTERNFGLTVGAVFAGIGTWWLIRGRFPVLSLVFPVLGSTLILLALVSPRTLVTSNRLWMLLSEAMSFVSTRIILSIVFFGIVTPLGFLRKVAGSDPLLRRSNNKESYWRPYKGRQLDRRHYEQMY